MPGTADEPAPVTGTHLAGMWLLIRDDDAWLEEVLLEHHGDTLRVYRHRIDKREAREYSGWADIPAPPTLLVLKGARDIRDVL